MARLLATLKLTGPPANPQYKYSTPMPPGVAVPDKVETRLGTLHFDSGVPDQASTDKLYDNLDFQRAVQAYLLGLPPVNQLANRSAILTMGPANTTVPIWEQLVDCRTVELTANDNTPYTWFWLDLRNGPLVLEVPPKVLGLIDDMWYNWVGRPRHHRAGQGPRRQVSAAAPWLQGRGAEGIPRRAMRDTTACGPAGAASWSTAIPSRAWTAVKKFTKIYRLSQAANRRSSNFVNMSGKPFNMVGPADYQFWEMLNQVVQEEPTDTRRCDDAWVSGPPSASRKASRSLPTRA